MAVFTIVCPVTVAAETAVKKDTSSDVNSESLLANGVASNNPPVMINRRKPSRRRFDELVNRLGLRTGADWTGVGSTSLARVWRITVSRILGPRFMANGGLH